MRLPKWALSDDKNKVKYLITVAALDVDPSASITELAKKAGLPYGTLVWAFNNSVSKNVAEKICKAAPDSGIKPHWLMNPEWIQINSETGEIVA